NDAMDYLYGYGTQKATKPHDHIYGLLGIIPEKDRVLLRAPDYDRRPEDLFMSVATKLMLAYNSLMLLVAAGMPAPLTAPSSTKMDLPSWVPDWTRPLPHGQRRESLLPYSETEFHFSEDSTDLTLTCFEIDKIESVKPVPGVAQGRMPIWQSAPETERTRDGQGPPLL
ncbi:hypothetical protein F5883DRAFT_429397, partial [Diaporthe sp. PMI_573]